MGVDLRGEVVVLGRAASVQFAREPLRFRVIRVTPGDTVEDWSWFDGYVLDEMGEALERRRLFVRDAGVRRARLYQPRSGPAAPVSPAPPVPVPAEAESGPRRRPPAPARRA